MASASKPATNIEEFLWNIHTALAAAEGPIELANLKDHYLKHHGHKCNIERFLVVGEGGLGATLRRIPHIVKISVESGTPVVQATQPADIDRARLIEEDKKYRREIATRNAAKAAAAGTSKAKAAPPSKAAPPPAEGKRPAESESNAENKKPRNDAEVETLAKMLIQGVVRVLQNRAKTSKGALPLAELEHEFKELWKVPFNVKQAGETDVLGFLQKWPGKVELLATESGSWTLQLAKKATTPPTAAKTAPAKPPPKAAPEEAPMAARNKRAGAPSQDMPANEPVEVTTTAERPTEAQPPAVAALSQRLPELQRQADKILVGMKALIAQQEALVADVVKLRG